MGRAITFPEGQIQIREWPLLIHAFLYWIVSQLLQLNENELAHGQQDSQSMFPLCFSDMDLLQRKKRRETILKAQESPMQISASKYRLSEGHNPQSLSIRQYQMRPTIKVLWVIFDTTRHSEQVYREKTKQFPFNSIDLIERYFQSDALLDFEIRVYLYQEMPTLKYPSPSQFDCLQMSFMGKDSTSTQQALNNHQFMTRLEEVVMSMQTPTQENYIMMTTDFEFNVGQWINSSPLKQNNSLQGYLIVLSMKQQQIQPQFTYQAWTMAADSRMRSIQIQFNKTNFRLSIKYQEDMMNIQGRNGRIVRVEQVNNQYLVKAVKDYETKEIWSPQIAGQVDLDKDIAPNGFVCTREFEGYQTNPFSHQGVKYSSKPEILSKSPTCEFAYFRAHQQGREQFVIPNMAEGVAFNNNTSFQGAKYYPSRDVVAYFGDLKGSTDNLVAEGSGIIVDRQGTVKQVDAKNDQFVVVAQNPIVIQCIRIGTRINPNHKVVIPLLQAMDYISYPFNQFQYQINQEQILSFTPPALMSTLRQRCGKSMYTILSVGQIDNEEELLKLIYSDRGKLTNLLVSVERPLTQMKKKVNWPRYLLLSKGPLDYVFQQYVFQVKIKLRQASPGVFEIQADIKSKSVLATVVEWQIDRDTIIVRDNRPAA